MKKIFALLLCISHFVISNAQDLNDIKEQNVVFILFDGDNEYEERINLSKKENTKIVDSYKYVFFYYDKVREEKRKFDFSFHYSKYQNYDDAENKLNPAMLFKINKSFIKKNKNLIITRDFFELIGEKTIINLLFRSNTYLFLIDKNEIEDNKLLLREVKFDYIPVDPEPIIENIVENE